ncbi:hypothetical protein [Teredinibacter haidensis]|uniref:hypothetical protein n=1 Tax=Teredinibacter haidensis TaxID=2731755 RepID=UPI000A7A6E2C|nr:hypothetical protein [Teredinibacter haidensis]
MIIIIISDFKPRFDESVLAGNLITRGRYQYRNVEKEEERDAPTHYNLASTGLTRRLSPTTRKNVRF